MTNESESKRPGIEIQVAANGYWVMDPDRNHSHLIRNDSIFVFETFDALTDWLRLSLKVPDKLKVPIKKPHEMAPKEFKDFFEEKQKVQSLSKDESSLGGP